MFLGKDGAVLLTLEGEKAGDAFGSSLTGKNGLLMVGAPAAGARGTGRVYVYKGLTAKPAFTMDSDETGGADAGDVDRDGADDLVIGAWQHGSGATSGGRVYIYSGRTQKLLRTITSRTPGDTFGFDTTNLGDVNGDGAIDFLITSAWSGATGFQSGRVFVIAGNSTRSK